MSYLSFLYAIDAALRIMFWLIILAVGDACLYIAGYAPACIPNVICLPF